MTNTLYSIILDGKVLEGFNADETQEKLAKLFKIQPNVAKRMLSGNSVTVKKGVDLEIAEKYKKALESAGAQCHIEEFSVDLQVGQEASTAEEDTGTDRQEILPESSDDKQQENKINVTATATATASASTTTETTTPLPQSIQSINKSWKYLFWIVIGLLLAAALIFIKETFNPEQALPAIGKEGAAGIKLPQFIEEIDKSNLAVLIEAILLEKVILQSDHDEEPLEMTLKKLGVIGGHYDGGVDRMSYYTIKTPLFVFGKEVKEFQVGPGGYALYVFLFHEKPEMMKEILSNAGVRLFDDQSPDNIVYIEDMEDMKVVNNDYAKIPNEYTLVSIRFDHRDDVIKIQSRGVDKQIEKNDVKMQPSYSAPAPQYSAPASGKQGVANAYMKLNNAIVMMESSGDRRCQSMANQLYKRMGQIDKMYEQGEMLEARMGNDGGRYNQIIFMIQQTQAQISQYGCNP